MIISHAHKVDKLFEENKNNRIIDLLGKGGVADAMAVAETLKSDSSIGLSASVLLWRLARSHWKISSVAKANKDKESRLVASVAANTAAKAALKSDPNSPMAHMFFAICNEENASATGVLKSKVEAGHKFKEHALKALQLLENCTENSSDENIIPGDVEMDLIEQK